MNYKPDFEDIFKKCFTENLKRELELLPSEGEISKTHKFSQKFVHKITKLIRSQNKKRYTFIRYAKKVAAVLLISLGIGAGILAISPKARAEVQNIIIEWLDTHIEFNSGENGILYNFNDIAFAVNYIPKGYEIVDTFNSVNINIIDYKNIKNKNDKFSIKVVLNSGNNSIITDNEKRSAEKIKVNSLDGYIFKSEKAENFNILVLYDEKITIKLVGTISVDELINIAENIKIKII